MGTRMRSVAVIILMLITAQVATVRRASAAPPPPDGWVEILCGTISAGGTALCCYYFPEFCEECSYGGQVVYDYCVDHLASSGSCEELWDGCDVGCPPPPPDCS